MLSYRHSFHAGNHADVLKHIVLTLILDALKQKEAPFVYYDTHSGAGRYDLQGAHATKTGEFKEGIELIWQRDDLPAPLANYVNIIKKLNPNGALRFYPGSPLIARTLLREQDKASLSELHPTDFALLLQEMRGDRQVKVFQEDGYARLKASLPPKTRRGVVLIDPPYELKTEYQDVVDGIAQSVKRFATGVYAIWYPVVYRRNVDVITRGLAELGIRKILQLELGVRPDSDEFGMSASGLIVINPPWQLHETMQSVLPWLQSVLAPQTGHHLVRWVVPE
ncbi:MAG: 23S rRNA (adenine(2030)-N(6))-methyltransferase RlmJ [Vibrionaceae bacterium]